MPVKTNNNNASLIKPLTTNGQYATIAKPATNEFKFNCGVIATIKPVSPFLVVDLRRAYPPPQPPTQEINGQLHSNPDHPDYIAAFTEWSLNLEGRLSRACVKLGVEVEVDVEKVANYKAVMESIGITLDEADDKVIYVTRCLIGDETEYQRLMTALNVSMQPTQEVVSAAKATF